MLLDKILIPVDDSELSHRILAHVRRILLASSAEVKLVRVLSKKELAQAKDRDEHVADARAHLAHVVALLKEQGCRASEELLVGDPAERILELATDWQPSLIALASHGRSGVERWLRGSTAERLLRRSTWPLLIANPMAAGSGTPWWEPNEGSRELARELAFKKILVPLDGSELSASVLPHVAEIAKIYDSQVILQGVHEPGEPSPRDDALDAFKARLPGITTEIRYAEGSPAAAIVDTAASELVDLVAIATHGRSGISRWAFGSVAEHVLRHASSPLLVVRTGGNE